MLSLLCDQAKDIWNAAVNAVRPSVLIAKALSDKAMLRELRRARRILVLGGGKAGTAMSAAVEECLGDVLNKVEGIVNVPAELVRPLKRIRLHAARPSGSNHPTLEGVVGTEEILRLAREAGPNDVALCLMSGGGSALLPAPAQGLTLADKRAITRLLHSCGATINEMNVVRKHLSAFKGGRLAQAFTGKSLYSLIISDVIGDPLDVIASGPTASDPSTFAEALAVLERYQLLTRRRPEGSTPAAVIEHLQRGSRGELTETPKTLPGHIHNIIIGNNVQALSVAENRARQLGFAVLNLGSYLEGDTRQLAIGMMGMVRGILEQGTPISPPACILSGGETTVTLGEKPGQGGRNQEFVLAALAKLGTLGNRSLEEVAILSGGSDGEDGPTDAAGAVGNLDTMLAAGKLGLNVEDFLKRHDSYTFFKATGGLLVTGLTGTNVMDLRVILVGGNK